MRIALIGYGKMGHAIEEIAASRGHEIALKVSSENDGSWVRELREIDVAIEFSQPDAAIDNMKACFNAGVPVVTGTTGWYDRMGEVEDLCRSMGVSLFYSTNFSVGVNLFFHVNELLAKLMGNRPEYAVRMEEIHHTEKRDSPSGTAITLARKIVDRSATIESWKNEPSADPTILGITSRREADVPGTHHLTWESDIDRIDISHSAKSRKGFALGAVLAAEWLPGNIGVFTMKDLLNF